MVKTLRVSDLECSLWNTVLVEGTFWKRIRKIRKSREVGRKAVKCDKDVADVCSYQLWLSAQGLYKIKPVRIPAWMREGHLRNYP